MALNSLSAEAQTRSPVFAILVHCANDNSLIKAIAKSKELEGSTLVGRLCIVPSEFEKGNEIKVDSDRRARF